MATLSKEHKTLLSDLLATGHRKFAKVNPRQAYHDDDEGGGSTGFQFESHPLLEEQPAGAASDLSAIPAEHAQSELADRVDENINNLSNELQARPSFQQALAASQTHTTKPSPLGGG